MNHDRNLLFGAIAVQTGLISTDQFVKASSHQSSNSLQEMLCQKGWLLQEDLVHIDYLVERRLARFNGDIRASFSVSPPEILSALASIGDSTVDAVASASGTTDTVLIEEGVDGKFLMAKAGQRYTLNSLHAAGGIGEIWLARDADLHRDVAVKKLQAKKAPSDIAKTRFLREAQITGRLDHPGVVPIYEICLDETTGEPYYSMRFLKGRTLTEAVKEFHTRRKSGGAESQAFLGLLNAFGIICNTVAYAHSKGIVHRDLKCENVILGNFGEVVVIDWGLARDLGNQEVIPPGEASSEDLTLIHPAATLAGHILGTPAYMAPEQAAGRIDLIGPATDVYGLCAILYEILCGNPPFQGTNALEVLDKVQHSAPVRPSEIAPGVPQTLEQICLKGLSKPIPERHASADILAKSVQGWVSDLAERRQAEEERERFFALSLDLLAIIDSDGALRQTSPAWERQLGYDRTNLTGVPFKQFIHEADRAAVIQCLFSAADSRMGHTFEAKAIHHDGSYRWLSWNVTPIAKERSLYVVGRDITDLKQSQQLFEGILQSAPDAMVLLNSQGRIVLANRQLEQVFGYTQEELIGQPIELLVPVRHRADHPEKVASFFASSSVRPMGSGIPLRGLHKHGHEFPAEIALSPIVTEYGKLVAASVRDVSDRMR